MTKAEQNAALKEANEKMKAYFTDRPPLEKIKRRTLGDPSQHKIQFAIGLLFVAAFVASPFLGKKIAQDEEFRTRYIPSWYDFTIKHETSEMSKEDMHETIVEHQRQLHERAIRGDFTPDKLQKLRATYYQAKQAQEQEEQEEDAAARRTLSNQQPSNDPYGWSKIHPGMDDDDDDDDDEE
eukprot:CAMPEP_0118696358 /NCGR_PEP_ID=MMETSP0800-20121206/13798_1 /TAXON_ID=210618 ORGANISM="Striatella unipunctata, Strain CCMP2910" /NCGR_SAMPLE_ID=MMETSP0800 /ASSEMBLY_ACC=CAM_ASM_000638 /LENGTH=180 /DNA_ID=CAMNT_0006595453 /DNA_START=92 /DNA_END=634 /DNA_ORIENTATION=-